MPATLRRVPRRVCARRVDRGYGAFRLVIEDEFCEEKAACEEIYTENVK